MGVAVAAVGADGLFFAPGSGSPDLLAATALPLTDPKAAGVNTEVEAATVAEAERTDDATLEEEDAELASTTLPF